MPASDPPVASLEPSPAPSPPSGEPAISVSGLCKTYTEGLFFKRRHEALKDVTLEVRRGEIFGLLGPNGAGKTTFLKIMLGIIRKTSGEASLLGYPAGSRDGRRKVGFLPEHLRLPRHLTGYQALEYFGNLSNVPTSTIRQKRGDLLETVGLAQRAKDSVRQYSKGMLQRLGLAQALLSDPELLVLDEPTDGLDPRARAEMRQIIRDLQGRGVTIFLNSHLLQEVEMVCQRVAILDKGSLRYCGEVETIGQFMQESSAGPQDPSVSRKDVVELELLGQPEVIQSCVVDQAHELKPLPDGRHLLVIGLASQGELDQLVDRLRSQQVSLITLNRRRVSLEDAFLKIVDEASFKN